MSNEIVVTVLELERNKIYRLNRRLEALNELLFALDNSTIEFSNKEILRKKLKDDIINCGKRIKNWWDIMSEKYNLCGEMTISFETGNVFKTVYERG